MRIGHGRKMNPTATIGQWGVMRRLNEKGTTLGLNIQNSDSWGNNESFSLSETTYFRLKDKNGNDSVLYRNQYLKSPPAQ